MEWIYGKRVKSFEAMTNLPAPLRKVLDEEFSFDSLESFAYSAPRIRLENTCFASMTAR
jgi:adenine C2-methylase RlmN of 23S rRNA A2503 and tRNA A37